MGSRTGAMNMNTDREPLYVGTVKQNKNTPQDREKAVLYIASNAKDAADCALLMSILGLSVEDVTHGQS